MRFSAFARFGHLRFTGKPPVGRVIYDSMRVALGGEENLPDSFEGPIAGDLFATAMALACAQRTVEMVKAERTPHTSHELIEWHERDYKVPVPSSATMDERRSALRAASLLSQGCSDAALTAALTELLGADLIKVRTLDSTEYVVTPANWDSPAGPGAWKRPNMIAKWRRLTHAAPVGLSQVSSVALHPDGDPFVAGDVVVADPGVLGLQERTVIEAWFPPTVRAVFTRPHEAGALITTEPWPAGQTTSRLVLVVVTSATLAVRKRVAALLQKMLRAVDRWEVVEESAPGVLGPFMVGVGKIGITPIGPIPT